MEQLDGSLLTAHSISSSSETTSSMHKGSNPTVMFSHRGGGILVQGDPILRDPIYCDPGGWRVSDSCIIVPSLHPSTRLLHHRWVQCEGVIYVGARRVGPIIVSRLYTGLDLEAESLELNTIPHLLVSHGNAHVNKITHRLQCTSVLVHVQLHDSLPDITK